MTGRVRVTLAVLLFVGGLSAPAPADPSRPADEALLKQALHLNRQGSLSRARGDLAGAEAHFREALDLWRKLYPAERYPDGHPNLATGLSNLGGLLRVRGKVAEAERCFREALVVARKLYPPERYPDGHIQLALILSYHGNVLRAAGDSAGAVARLRESLAMQRKLNPAAPDADTATTLSNLGVALQDRGDLAEAANTLRQAVAAWQLVYPRERCPDGHTDLAHGLNNLARALVANGDCAGAEECLREALACWRKLYPPDRYPDGHPDLALGLSNAAVVSHARGDALGAAKQLREALAMYEKLYPPSRYPDGHPHLANALHGLGSLLREAGDPGEPWRREGGEALLQRALTMRRKLYPPSRYPNGHPELVKALLDWGERLVHDQDAGAGMPLLEALAMCRKLFPPQRYPGGHPLLARSVAAVVPYFELVSRHGDRFPHPQKGDWDVEAVSFAHQAVAMYRKLYPPSRYPDGYPDLARCLHRLGHLLWVRGNPGRAEAAWRESLAMLRKLYRPEHYPDGHPALANALTYLGVLLHERGDRAGAEAHLGEALAVQRRLQDVFLSGAGETEGLLFLASLPSTRSAYLSATRRGASAETAYAAVWASRGALARALQARRQALLLAREPATRDLARQWAATRQALARLLLSPAEERPGQAARARALSERKTQLERELAARLPGSRSLYAGPRHTPADLVKRLPAGTAFIDLLAYVRMGQDATKPGVKGRRWVRCYVAFVLAPGQPIRRVELGPAKEIDETVDAWRRELTAGGAGETAAASLRDRLWRRLETWLPAGTRTVLLAPDGALTRLPWAALPGRRPGSVLLEEYALGVVPYGQFLCDGIPGGRTAGRQDGALLVVGDVAFGDRPKGVAVADAAAGAGRVALAADAKPLWHALPGTAAELRRVRELAGARPVRVLHGTEASTAGLLAELPRAGWAHVATHGFFADARVRSVLRLDENDYARGFRDERVGAGARNPLVLSGLVLAGANLPARDPRRDDRGILSAEAIAGLDLGGLDLAVLSACETGLGEVAGGEGVFGLLRAFHAGGARSVVASLWKVDDGATQDLMARFYENLWHKKLPKLEALRQAQLAVFRGQSSAAGVERGPDLAGIAAVQGRKPASAAPHAWAAWILSGDPGDLSSVRPVAVTESAPPALVTARPADSMLPYAALGGMLGGLALAAGWWVLRRRPRT